MDIKPFTDCLAHKQSVYISNDTDAYRPCCWFKTGINVGTLHEYREKLSKLDIAKNCAHCIKQEERGATWSHRHLFTNPKEFVLGVCFDNVCNLKCVTCSPVYSSQLIGEWDDLGLYKNPVEKKHYIKVSKQAPIKIEFIKDVLVNSKFDVLKLEIFGGEPLINPFVFKFIDWVAEQPYAQQTLLSITSNASTYTDKIKEYTKKFKLVSLQLSIDGIQSTFEYLRYGNNWKNSKKVIEQYYALIDDYSNFSLAFNYTLSWMNCLHFADFYNYIMITYPKLKLHLTKLEGPDYFSVNVLSQNHRNKIVDTVDKNLIGVPINDDYRKLYDLYKQSMLVKGFDNFNFKLYTLGKKTLSDKDNLRTMKYQEILQPILTMIEQWTH